MNITQLYNYWLQQQKASKTGYFLLSNNIQEYLPMLKTPALNLYIFYAIHAKNEYGSSYYSNERIAKELGVSQKTISNWNRLLQDIGLITRKAQQNSSSITYLLPTSDFTIKSNDQEKIGEIINLLDTEKYIMNTPITITVINNNPPQTFRYYQFQKKYSKDNFSVTRKITIEDLTIQSVLSKNEINLIENSLSWFPVTSNESPLNNSLNLIWQPKNNEKNTNENRQSIVNQLDSKEAIEMFKQKYPQTIVNLS